MGSEYIDELLQNFEGIDEKIIYPLSFINNSDNFGPLKGRLNILIGRIIQHNKTWLDGKVNKFKTSSKTQTTENFSALMGEIRVYGELLGTYAQNSILTPNSGSDFQIKIDDEFVNIEVHTPQKTASKKNTSYEKPFVTSLENGIQISTQISSCAPYGYPTEVQYSIQNEAVSKFAGIKSSKEGKQFSNENVSILWLDMNDPTVSIFSQADQCKPILSFNARITSGAIWYAFYGKKDDWIYADFCGQGNSSASKMDHDGRFFNERINSKIDFVIIDVMLQKYIFQNPNSQKKISSKLYHLLLQLDNIQLSESFLNFDLHKLKECIENTRDRNNSYYMFLNTWLT